MGLYNDLILRFGLPVSERIGGDTVTLCQGKGALIEGHKGVFFYSEERTVVSINGGKMEIIGKGLEILEINSDELYIRGKIECITRMA